MAGQLVVHRTQGLHRDLGAALQAMRAVHQHLGLDDRHQTGLLRQRRVAGQGVGVGVDAGRRRPPLADAEHRPPLGEARPSDAYSANRLPRPSSPSVTTSSGKPASGVVPRSTLMPGIMPRRSNSSGNGVPSSAR